MDNNRQNFTTRVLIINDLRLAQPLLCCACPVVVFFGILRVEGLSGQSETTVSNATCERWTEYAVVHLAECKTLQVRQLSSIPLIAVRPA